MQLKRLSIRNLRNIEEASLKDFGQINIIFGPNGSGKTSLLEGIHLLSLARSFRGSKISPIISRNTESCTVFGEVTDVARGSTLSVGVTRATDGSSQVKLQGRPLRTLAELAEQLPLQVIHAETFALLTGSPSGRRQFLDWGVFHVEHRFHPVWTALQRCLKQRNSLLRRGKIQPSELLVWDIELARLGSELDVFRRRYFELLEPAFFSCLNKLTQIDNLSVSVHYHRGWDKASELQAVLRGNLEKDIERGYTTSGPHRADIRFRLGGVNAADVLSRGQQKLLICALRLAQGFVLKQVAGKECVYLVDDLPAELDLVHRKQLCGVLEELNAQVFVTCVDFRSVVASWTQNASLKVFHVEHGKVSPWATSHHQLDRQIMENHHE